MTDCKPRCQALVSCVTGCGRGVGVELRIVETNALQRDETPSSLRTLLVLRRVESELRSDAQVKEAAPELVNRVFEVEVLDQEEQQEE